jgi:hypothetical protein
MNVITSVGAGMIAGAVGTAAMDLLWYRRYRRQGGRVRFLRWESGGDITTWDAASAPGEVGRKLEELLTGITPPDSWARPTTNAVHWATGIGWGLSYAVARTLFTRSGSLAVALGPAAWLTSYAILPLIKVYEPIWKYDARTLGKDLTAHLVYGLTTASVFRIVTKGLKCNSSKRTP